MSVVVWGTLVIQNRPDAVVKLRAVCFWVACVDNNNMSPWTGVRGGREGQCGRVVAGTPEEPFEGQLAFVTKGDMMTEVHQCGYVGGPRKIAVSSGAKLELYGRRPARMWTRLRSTVAAGERRLKVLGKVDWRYGDEVYIATTSSGRHGRAETWPYSEMHSGDENIRVVSTRRIRSLDGRSWDTEVLLQTPCKFRHVSVIEYHDGYVLDMRVEVGLFDSWP